MLESLRFDCIIIYLFIFTGVVGDWKNWFTVAQREMFDELWKKKMKDSLFKFRYEPFGTNTWYFLVLCFYVKNNCFSTIQQNKNKHNATDMLPFFNRNEGLCFNFLLFAQSEMIDEKMKEKKTKTKNKLFIWFQYINVLLQINDASGFVDFLFKNNFFPTIQNNEVYIHLQASRGLA